MNELISDVIVMNDRGKRKVQADALVSRMDMLNMNMSLKEMHEMISEELAQKICEKLLERGYIKVTECYDADYAAHRFRAELEVSI